MKIHRYMDGSQKILIVSEYTGFDQHTLTGAVEEEYYVIGRLLRRWPSHSTREEWTPRRRDPLRVLYRVHPVSVGNLSNLVKKKKTEKVVKKITRGMTWVVYVEKMCYMTFTERGTNDWLLPPLDLLLFSFRSDSK